MNLSLYIARRYLISKKSHHAINLISMVAVCGVAVATLSMVCAMSVFNGFHDMVREMFCNFDPQLKITAVKGKVFDSLTPEMEAVKRLPEIELFSESLEDQVLLKYEERQAPAILKGVSDNFEQLTHISSTIGGGDFILHDEWNNYGIIGRKLATTLSAGGFVFPLEILVPKRNAEVNLINPWASFYEEYIYIGGIFTINQPIYDDNYLIVPIDLTRKLFDYSSEISALELKLKPHVNEKKAQRTIQKLLGDGYVVSNQYQQQRTSFQMMNIEKWITFLILSFILLIATFNGIGSLSMLMVEKKQDVITLRNLGATDRQISHIFLYEGWLISIVGALIGIVSGLVFCYLQQTFGLISLGDSGAFVVDSYPVKIIISDVFFVFLTVIMVGFLSTFYPVRYLSKKWLR